MDFLCCNLFDLIKSFWFQDLDIKHLEINDLLTSRNPDYQWYGNFQNKMHPLLLNELRNPENYNKYRYVFERLGLRCEKYGICLSKSIVTLYTSISRNVINLDTVAAIQELRGLETTANVEVERFKEIFFGMFEISWRRNEDIYKRFERLAETSK